MRANFLHQGLVKLKSILDRSETESETERSQRACSVHGNQLGCSSGSDKMSKKRQPLFISCIEKRSDSGVARYAMESENNRDRTDYRRRSLTNDAVQHWIPYLEGNSYALNVLLQLGRLIDGAQFA